MKYFPCTGSALDLVVAGLETPLPQDQGMQSASAMGLAWAAFHARQCHRVCGPRVAARAWERRRAVDTEWTQGKVVFDPETKSAFDQQFRAVRVIHLAMLLSLAAYLVLGLILRPALAIASETEVSGWLVKVFYAVCAGIVLAISFCASASFSRRGLVRPLVRRLRAGPGRFGPGISSSTHSAKRLASLGWLLFSWRVPRRISLVSFCFPLP
jgi:hypothetical protein